jgi:pimeloyl-ACP methyl ester carboxylesterase
MDLATNESRFEATDAHAGEDRFFGLPDGRTLGYTEFGDPLGLPVFGFHGTPGSRFMFRLAHEPARRLGLRIIAPDRPGFGLSDYQENRTLADWTKDVHALAGKLGLDRFAVAGISGGGPYVAACAALLPENVTTAALISPVGPLHSPEGPDNLPPAHILTFRLLPHVTPAMRGAFSLGRVMFMNASDTMYQMIMRRAGAADEHILLRPEVRKNLLAGVIEGFRPGVQGVVEEMRLFAKPWNIPFEAIQAPVLLWQGAADNNVPVAASLRLAEIIPGCELFRIEGAGHYWIFDHMEEVLVAIKQKIIGMQKI